jgi:hypothetical protein
MPDSCAPKPALVNMIIARDQIVHLLDTSPRISQLLAMRIVSVGAPAAYAMTVRDCLAELPAIYEDDVADAVRRVMIARLPKQIRRVRRARRAA